MICSVSTSNPNLLQKMILFFLKKTNIFSCKHYLQRSQGWQRSTLKRPNLSQPNSLAKVHKICNLPQNGAFLLDLCYGIG
jgi:hypothetical protein